MAGFGDMAEARQLRLTALGLAAGDRVRMVQRRPVPMVQVGKTEVAVGDEILSQIHLVAGG